MESEMATFLINSQGGHFRLQKHLNIVYEVINHVDNFMIIFCHFGIIPLC